MKALFTLLCILSSLATAHAQLNINCNGSDRHALYLFTYGTGYYRIDNVDATPSNPVFLASDPINAIGISLNQNFATGGDDIAMYAIGNSAYYSYWNGSNWINTGHTGGSVISVNPGGTSKYIFNLDGSAGTVYRYNGTGNATLLVSGLPTSGKSFYDIGTDKAGNFYIFYSTNQKIVCYDEDGLKIDSFTTSGTPAATQPGFAILGNNMYIIDNPVGDSSFLYRGIVSGKTVNFTKIKKLTPNGYSDIAACPDAGEVLAVRSKANLPELKILPNPASEITTIVNHNVSMLEVFDCVGKVMLQTPLRGTPRYELQVSGWPAGIYFIRATNEDGNVTQGKLIVR